MSSSDGFGVSAVGTELLILLARLDLARARLELERDRVQQQGQTDLVSALSTEMLILARLRNDVETALSSAGDATGYLAAPLDGTLLARVLRGAADVHEDPADTERNLAAEMQVVWAELEALRGAEAAALQRLADLQRQLGTETR